MTLFSRSRRLLETLSLFAVFRIAGLIWPASDLAEDR
jgi:hypothetical protein